MNSEYPVAIYVDINCYVKRLVLFELIGFI